MRASEETALQKYKMSTTLVMFFLSTFLAVSVECNYVTVVSLVLISVFSLSAKCEH